MHSQRSDITKIHHAGLLMEESLDRNNTQDTSAMALKGNPTAVEGWKHPEISPSHSQNNRELVKRI